MSRRSNRARTPMQWIALRNTTALVAGVTQYKLVEASAAATGSQVPNISRMTIMRIVGQLSIVNGANQCDYDMGIICAQNVNGTTVVNDPSNQADQDASWLWLRHIHLLGSATLGPSVSDFVVPFGSSFDITVKRKLMPNQTLVLNVNNASAVAATVTSLNVRILIARVA